MTELGRKTLSTDSMVGTTVVTPDGETLGKVEAIMLDTDSGTVAYVVLSFGGIFGVGSKLYAIAWDAMQLDQTSEWFILDITKEDLENAPELDRTYWPDEVARADGAAVYTEFDPGRSVAFKEGGGSIADSLSELDDAAETADDDEG